MTQIPRHDGFSLKPYGGVPYGKKISHHDSDTEGSDHPGIGISDEALNSLIDETILDIDMPSNLNGNLADRITNAIHKAIHTVQEDLKSEKFFDEYKDALVNRLTENAISGRFPRMEITNAELAGGNKFQIRFAVLNSERKKKKLKIKFSMQQLLSIALGIDVETTDKIDVKNIRIGLNKVGILFDVSINGKQYKDCKLGIRVLLDAIEPYD